MGWDTSGTDGAASGIDNWDRNERDFRDLGNPIRLNPNRTVYSTCVRGEEPRIFHKNITRWGGTLPAFGHSRLSWRSFDDDPVGHKIWWNARSITNAIVDLQMVHTRPYLPLEGVHV